MDRKKNITAGAQIDRRLSLDYPYAFCSKDFQVDIPAWFE